MRARITQLTLAHLLLAVGALVMIYPLLYIVFASLNSQSDFVRSSGILPVPPQFTLKNYAVILHPKVFPLILTSVGVTMLRIAWFILTNGAVAILLGYVFARLRFRGKNFVFLVLLASMLVPGIVFQVPLFVMMARWPLAGGNDLLGQGGSGLLNSIFALLMPGMINVYFVFLLRQTFFSIPIDFEEAARIEGASFLQILRHVYWPMLKPTMAVVAITTTVANWNDYVWPLMVVSGNHDLWPTSMLFQRLMSGGLPTEVAQSIATSSAQTLSDIPLILTFGVVATIPMVIFFFFFQRGFMEGLQGGGLKG